MIRGVILFAAVTLVAALSFGATIHVPSQQPTIQAGINAAANGDTVLVAPGTYTENLMLSNKEIHVLSESGASSTSFKWNLNGTAPFLMSDNATLEFSGFNWSSDDVSGHCFDVQKSNLVLSHNVFDRLSVGALVFAESTGTTVMSRNVFSRITTSNAMFIAWNGAVARITNNTIDSVQKGVAVYTDGSLVENNIFSRSTMYGYYHGGYDVTERYNCFWGNASDTYDSSALDLTDVSGDPEFLDVASGNYSIRATSPCANAGNPGVEYLDPDGTRNDMGAFPHDNVPPTAPVPYAPQWPDITVSTTPDLSVVNATDAENDALTYDYEVFRDSLLTDLAVSGTNIPEMHSPESTIWTVTPPLDDNKYYYWRARAFDGYEYSPWSSYRFFIANNFNEPPNPFTLIDPPDSTGSILYNRKPTFRWTYTGDPDPYNQVRYKLELAVDPAFSFKQVIDSLYTSFWIPPDSLPYHSHYWWRVSANDQYGATTLSPNVKEFWVWTLGDVDHSNNVDIADLSRLIDYLYISFGPIEPRKVGDLDGDCTVDIADLSRMIDYLYISLDENVLIGGCGP